MENNENNAREHGAEKNNDAKKPYHKHNHHRRKPKPRENGDVINELDVRGGAISVRPGRYDLPPEAAAAVKPAEKPQEPAPAESKEHADGGEVRHHKTRRGGRRRGGRGRHGEHNENEEKLNLTEASDDADEVFEEHAQKKPVQQDEKESDEAAPAASDSAAEASEEEHHDGRRRRRSRGVRRRGGRGRPHQNDEQTEADELSGEYEEPVGDLGITEETFSEYITFTEGDEEVIGELNSITADQAEALEPAEPEVELEKYEIVGVRFKPAGKIYYFDPCGMVFAKNDALVVETARGLEYGICELANRIVTEREVVLPLRRCVRPATADDTARHEANVVREKEAFTICAEKILDHKLEMKLIDVEYTFDNSKLLFYFTADGRVDFRELVKDLASVFRTRIELRQIGIRDETKLLGGIGICGRPFCCKTFLSDFVQVSIKMAKEQNLSLNSVKISGTCGRLMCCLRYEYDTYQEEIRKTPRVDQIVATPDGDGTVIEVQPLAGLVRVRFGEKSDMPPKVYHRDDVKVIGGKGVKIREEAPGAQTGTNDAQNGQ